METRDTVFIATFAAITAALAVFPPMTLPVVGVPITAQSLGAILAGGVLGARRGGLSMILFLILVAIGLPLLSGGRGGFGVFMRPTGGFLLGWVVTAVVVGLLVERLWQRLGYVTAFLADGRDRRALRDRHRRRRARRLPASSICLAGALSFDSTTQHYRAVNVRLHIRSRVCAPLRSVPQPMVHSSHPLSVSER